MIKGKSCLIISATADIGEAIALKFAQSGVSRLFLHGRNKENLSQIANNCRINYSVEVETFLCDLYDTNQIQVLNTELTKQIKCALPSGLDLFVFCAGNCGDMDPVAFLPIEKDFMKVMQLNFLSCVQIFENVVPLFSQNSSAIFITSTNTTVPLACGSAYSSSKCALKQFMEKKALELGERGIRVNNVAPGVVATKLHDRYFDTKEELNLFINKCKSEHPLGRIATTDGVANSAMFLCSDLACDINGTEMIVDCGETLEIPELKNGSSEGEEEEED